MAAIFGSVSAGVACSISSGVYAPLSSCGNALRNACASAHLAKSVAAILPHIFTGVPSRFC